ncbi:MAG: NADH-quinone oxidoreductase subunit J [bacterium]|nr:NADH-quinone oxidoreductase subunit J [bacterium]MCP4967141.1 NADH-quinone oxidoreductase subunit J [bacterium]
MFFAVTVGDWLGEVENWVFAVLAIAMVYAAIRVVTTKNVVHAALFLVIALGGSAAIFLLLGAEFVAWTVVMVYIGAVIVLFLFGIMITRAPLGYETKLSHPRRVRIGAALASGALFLLIGGAMLDAFGDDPVPAAIDPTRTSDIGQSIFERFVIPFEVVSFVLLAALIGGIVIARQDPTVEEEEVLQ